MSITSTTDATALTSTTSSAYENPNGVLGKDDFLQLLLVELQYQDPTEPTDTEQILTQTSQLATLESTENTNKALEELSASLMNSQQFSMISAIGKTADLGSNAISYDEGELSSFEIYFPQDVASGEVEILDGDGNVIDTIPLEAGNSGVYQFDWDGLLSDGSSAESALYYVTASYTTPNNEELATRVGTYPIESVRFEDGVSLVKVGSSYIPADQIKEIY
ncbi:MAG: flagellar hook capping protein [Epsilonproteobacteria bacterium]|nr:flagellar hook capping protein [Campylobacterota bacterium]